VIISCPEYSSKRRKKKEWEKFFTQEHRRWLHFYCNGVGNDMRSEPCRGESSVSICANEEE
jgi:hypothetical protein